MTPDTTIGHHNVAKNMFYEYAIKVLNPRLGHVIFTKKASKKRENVDKSCLRLDSNLQPPACKPNAFSISYTASLYTEWMFLRAIYADGMTDKIMAKKWRNNASKHGHDIVWKYNSVCKMICREQKRENMYDICEKQENVMVNTF